jgi:hypothetical protein
MRSSAGGGLAGSGQAKQGNVGRAAQAGSLEEIGSAGCVRVASVWMRPSDVGGWCGGEQRCRRRPSGTGVDETERRGHACGQRRACGRWRAGGAVACGRSGRRRVGTWWAVVI